MRATIKDVARLAGVSPATVSLVLNGKPVSIPEKTRSAVFAAARELNYSPNQLAVGLVTSRSNSIGLILPDAENLFFASMAKYVEQSAMQHGYAVVTSNTGDSCEKTCQYLQFFSDRRVDGIILTQADFQDKADTDRILSIITDMHIPIVLVDRAIGSYNLPSVLVDQKKVGFIATRHLLEMGHRRIGCVTGPRGMNTVSDRLDGYRQALESFGVDFDSSLIYEGKYDIRTGSDSVPFLLGKNVSAAFCMNDYIAFGVYREMRNLGRPVPDALSVVGVDDTILADIIQPPLTTVQQPVAQIAELAVGQLIRQIDHAGSAEENSMPPLDPVLKVRASVRPFNGQNQQ